MKKLIITVLTTILIASEGISQTSTDTTCIPNTQLKKVINRIEACKVLEEELALSKEQLNLAKDRINLKDTTILKLQLQGSNYERLIENYKKTETTFRSIVDNQEKQIVLQKKLIRRKGFSKWIVGALGIGIGYFIAK
jgi:hypothetical protein